jgi:hypothetical protein
MLKNNMLLKISCVLLIGTLLLLPACVSSVAAPSVSLPTTPTSALTSSPPSTYTQSPSPLAVPTPTHPPFSTNVVFTKITESLTLSDNESGTHIPWGSVIYHWANGITEAYSANNSLIFISKDSEAARLPHPSGPNGPFESPATFIIGVPNGALISSDPSDNTTMRIYLDHINKILILTIITKSEDYPLDTAK